MTAGAVIRGFPSFSAMGSDGRGCTESDVLRTLCGLTVSDDGKTWLNYDQAARRVRSDPRTIRNWRRAGMPMGWRLGEHGQRERVVELDVLLSWWREKMRNNPAHVNRMRRQAREAGMPVPAPVPRRKPAPAPEEPRTPESGGFGRTEPESDIPARAVDPLADMSPLRGGAEYFVLTEAMKVSAPGCAGIGQFTADRRDLDEARMLAAICAACPLLAECEAFARASRPTAG